MQLNLEVNQKAIQERPGIRCGGTVLMVTPDINEAYYLMRVPVSEKQAVVCFPKFCTIGIGFQHERDWNTNLPYTQPAEDIFRHISHNKGDESIPDERCIEAIRMLQDAIENLKAAA